MTKVALPFQEAVHRVGEAVPLPPRAAGSSHIRGEQEGRRGHERVAVMQVASAFRGRKSDSRAQF